MSDMIDLTNVDLGVENLGDMWLDFTVRCNPEHAKLFNESYNLITLSFPNSFIDTELNHLLIDESLETVDLISHVRLLFINTIIDALKICNIFIDKDFIEMNHLEPLKIILDTVYLADGITDLIGLHETLTDEEADPKERFLKVVRMVQPEYETLMEDMEYYVDEVGVKCIDGLLIGINVIDEDDDTIIDHTLKTRIRSNKNFLTKTFAAPHIANGGGIGQDIDAYFALFANELAQCLVDGEPTVYLYAVLSLMIISDMTDKQIMGQYTSLVEDHCTSVEEAYKAMNILKEVKLDA